MYLAPLSGFLIRSRPRFRPEAASQTSSSDTRRACEGASRRARSARARDDGADDDDALPPSARRVPVCATASRRLLGWMYVVDRQMLARAVIKGHLARACRRAAVRGADQYLTCYEGRVGSAPGASSARRWTRLAVTSHMEIAIVGRARRRVSLPAPVAHDSSGTTSDE